MVCVRMGEEVRSTLHIGSEKVTDCVGNVSPTNADAVAYKVIMPRGLS